MASRRPSAIGDLNFLTTTGTELPTRSQSSLSTNNTRRNSISRGGVATSATRSPANSIAQQNTLNSQSTSETRQSQRPPPPIWRPSIRIRRTPSSNNLALAGRNPHINEPLDNTISRRDLQVDNTSTPHIDSHLSSNDDAIEAERRRSSSEPQRPAWLSSQSSMTAGPPRVRAGSYIPDIVEEASPTKQEGPTFAPINSGREHTANKSRVPLQHSHSYNEAVPNGEGEYDTELVDFLDLVGW